MLPFRLQFQHQSSLYRSRTRLDLGLDRWTTKSIASDPWLSSLQVCLCLFTCSDVFMVALLGDRERTAASACHALHLRFDELAPTIAFRWQSHGVSMLEYRWRRERRRLRIFQPPLEWVKTQALKCVIGALIALWFPMLIPHVEPYQIGNAEHGVSGSLEVPGGSEILSFDHDRRTPASVQSEKLRPLFVGQWAHSIWPAFQYF